MFEESKEPVTEVTENADEQTAEEIVNDSEDVEKTTEQTAEPVEETENEPVAETFTKEQVDEMIAKKLARKEAKLRREYEKRYGRAETILKAGLNKDKFEDAVEELEKFYTQEGVKIPEVKYSQRDTEILAKADADEIIELGYDDLVEETNRLASIKLEDMTDREKIMFQKLAEERKRIEEEKELKSLGINQSDEFKEFSKKLNPNLTMKQKYEMYLELKPKKEIEKMGSMKSGPKKEIKEHYSEEEIKKLTLDDLDDPVVWENVRKSMTGQK